MVVSMSVPHQNFVLVKEPIGIGVLEKLTWKGIDLGTAAEYGEPLTPHVTAQ
jgi:hypothetical protein